MEEWWSNLSEYDQGCFWFCFMDNVRSNSSICTKRNHTTTFIVFTLYAITRCSLWSDGVLICIIVAFILAGRICFFLPSEKANNNDETIISINWPPFFQRLSNKIFKPLSKGAADEESSIISSSYQSSPNIHKIYCRYCGKDNPASLEYCLQCRRQITVSPSQIMNVREKYGLAVNDDSVYCYSCGTNFFDEIFPEEILKTILKQDLSR